MKATVIKISEKPSKYGGMFHYIFLKSLDESTFGRSYRTCVGDNFRNFNRWEGVKPGMILDGLNLVRRERGWIVDADSQFSIVGEGQPQEGLAEVK